MIAVAYHPIYAHPLPAGHRFPMLKYELIPGQLMHEGTLTPEHFFEPLPCPEDVLLYTHDTTYWQHMKTLQLTEKEIRRIGFPLDAQLVQREVMIAQGTIDCALHALQHGCALNVAGGTHHAFADSGEGFCLLNDFAIAANYLLRNNMVKRIAIIDLDVHQGNGTAALFNNSKNVFTFSMHGARNFPFHKETSTLDVPLEDGTGDDDYLGLLGYYLPDILDTYKPDIVFYVSGVDILSTDKYGKLNVSIEGCKMRDTLVFNECIARKIPVAVAMGGGYSPDIKNIVEAHCNTFRVAGALYGV